MCDCPAEGHYLRCRETPWCTTGVDITGRGGGLLKRKVGTRPTGRMARYIRGVVQASTATKVSNPRTDPKPFKATRSMKRLVRMQITDTQTIISPSGILTTEAGYYGMTSRRWNSVKVLAMTFYGRENINAIAVQVYKDGRLLSQLHIRIQVI